MALHERRLGGRTLLAGRGRLLKLDGGGKTMNASNFFSVPCTRRPCRCSAANTKTRATLATANVGQQEFHSIGRLSLAFMADFDSN